MWLREPSYNYNVMVVEEIISQLGIEELLRGIPVILEGPPAGPYYYSLHQLLKEHVTPIGSAQITAIERKVKYVLVLTITKSVFAYPFYTIRLYNIIGNGIY